MSQGKQQCEGQEGLKLLCFDWDQTITVDHMNVNPLELHPTSRNFDIPQSYIYGPKASQQLPKAIEPYDNELETLQYWLESHKQPLAHEREIKEMIELAFEKDIKIAIVTFNFNPDLIFCILKNLEIRDAVLSNMVIIYGGDSVGNKNIHLKGAMQCFKIQEKKEVLFVDDSLSNVRAAKKEGYNCLIAEYYKKWIGEVMERLTPVENIDWSGGPPTISREAILALNEEFINPQSDLNLSSKVHVLVVTRSISAPLLSIPTAKSWKIPKASSATKFSIRAPNDEPKIEKASRDSESSICLFKDEPEFGSKRPCSVEKTDTSSTIQEVGNSLNSTEDTASLIGDAFTPPPHSPSLG